MALQLTGAKTLIVAGSPISCLETYTGESYRIPFTLTSSGTIPPFTTSIDSIKYYEINATNISNTSITINSIQTFDVGGFTPGSANVGVTSLTGSSGTVFFSNLTPPDYFTPPNLNENPILLCILTLRLTDTSQDPDVIYREPIGVLIRYQ